MATRWTPERRARQAELIKAWRPWEQSTGPRSEDGKAVVAQNAYKGGHRDKLREIGHQVNEEIRRARTENKQPPPTHEVLK